ncbi:MAG: type II toxin-antitoxin system HicB family antitoxin [Chitinivibrionia bacterium]|nr:type II toxin-antitoxin system HicB family antitoxin [Chitinivibrionia bacterium]
MSFDDVKKYSYLIVWSQEDNAYIACCAEFPSLSAHGETKEKALAEIENVVGASIEWLEEENDVIPLPLWQKKSKNERIINYAFA